MRTGMRSNKPKDINYRDAVMDPDTRLVFIQSMLYILTQDFIHLRSINRSAEIACNYEGLR